MVGLVAIRSPLINDIECCMIKREYKCDEIEVCLVFLSSDTQCHNVLKGTKYFINILYLARISPYPQLCM